MATLSPQDGGFDQSRYLEGLGNYAEFGERDAQTRRANAVTEAIHFPGWLVTRAFDTAS